jgi:hypothetical protein
MDSVNYSCPEHAPAIAEIRRFCSCPSACRTTGRVKQDLIRLKLTKGQVLDHVAQHIDAELPIYYLLLTMYFETPQPAYVIKRLLVGKTAIYFKVSLPQLEAEEKPYMLMMSAHEPDN